MIWLSLASLAANSGPVVLHTLGWFASPGSPVLFPLMFVIGGLQVGFIVMTSTLGASRTVGAGTASSLPNRSTVPLRALSV